MKIEKPGFSPQASITIELGVGDDGNASVSISGERYEKTPVGVQTETLTSDESIALAARGIRFVHTSQQNAVMASVAQALEQFHLLMHNQNPQASQVVKATGSILN